MSISHSDEPFVAKKGFGKTYFITDGIAIKIGIAEHSVYDRLSCLQSGAYRQLYLMGTISGTDNERTIQRRFSSLKIRGEWFRPEPELIDFIKQHSAINREFDFGVFKDAGSVIYCTRRKRKARRRRCPSLPPFSMRIADAAIILGCTRRKIGTMLDNGELRPRRFGLSARRKVFISSVQEYLIEHGMSDDKLKEVIKLRHGD